MAPKETRLNIFRIDRKYESSWGLRYEKVRENVDLATASQYLGVPKAEIAIKLVEANSYANRYFLIECVE